MIGNGYLNPNPSELLYTLGHKHMSEEFNVFKALDDAANIHKENQPHPIVTPALDDILEEMTIRIFEGIPEFLKKNNRSYIDHAMVTANRRIMDLINNNYTQK